MKVPIETCWVQYLSYAVLAALLAGTIGCGSDSVTSLASSTRSAPAAPSAQSPGSVSSSTGPTTNENKTRLEGAIANLAGTCPSVTFTLNGTNVSTSASTYFLGGTCTQLANGGMVFVRGTLQSGAVIADEVRSEATEAHVHGTLSGLRGNCPSLAFTVDNMTVSTTGATHFFGGTCGQLTNGVSVFVEGILQNDVVEAEDVRTNMPDTDTQGT